MTEERADLAAQRSYARRQGSPAASTALLRVRRARGAVAGGVRVATAKLGVRPRPTFLVVGTQKGGTSSLYEYLTRHPKVRAARRKEVHFFDRDHDRGWNWYLTQFPMSAALPGTITGEATPYYMFHPEIPERIARVLPGVKLVALLRDPVARAYSHYQHTVRHGIDVPTFEEALDLERRAFDDFGADPSFYDSDLCHRHSYVARGVYVEQLRRLLEVFPRDQLLVLTSERFYREPAEHLGTVLDFLGLPPWQPREFPMYNAGGYAETRIEPTTLASLRAYYRPRNRALEELLGMDFGDWDQ